MRSSRSAWTISRRPARSCDVGTAREGIPSFDIENEGLVGRKTQERTVSYIPMPIGWEECEAECVM